MKSRNRCLRLMLCSKMQFYFSYGPICEALSTRELRVSLRVFFPSISGTVKLSALGKVSEQCWSFEKMTIKASFTNAFLCI